MGFQLGQYELVRHIGSGGFADVYEGVQNPIGRKVAIKVLKPELVSQADFRERFLLEAKLTAKLDHPHIVRIIDFVHQGANIAIIMEFVDGEPLDAYLKRLQKPIPQQVLLPYFLQILDAVGYAHKAGILHRDIKPSNLFITPKGIKLVDFGIARAIENGDMGLTQTGMQLGSPLYMSPEQVLGKTASARTDIYALGLLLFEMATRQHPFQEVESQYVLQERIVRQPFPSPRGINQSIPLWLEKAIQIATAKDPLHRFASCEAFGAYIRTEGQKAAASPPVDKPIQKQAAPHPPLVSALPPIRKGFSLLPSPYDDRYSFTPALHGRRVLANLIDIVLIAITFGLAAIVILIMQLGWGSSPGRWVCGIRILARKGSPATPGQIILRGLFRSWVPVLLIIISGWVAYHLIEKQYSNTTSYSRYESFNSRPSSTEEIFNFLLKNAKTAPIRWLVSTAVLWYLIMLGSFLFISQERQRTLYDWIAGTRVFQYRHRRNLR